MTIRQQTIYLLLMTLVAGCVSQPSVENILTETSDANQDMQRPKLIAAFFSTIKSVADSGTLNDPAAMEKILNMHFESQKTEAIPQPASCNKPRDMRNRTTTVMKALGGIWYRPTVFGVKNLSVSSFAVNPAFTVSEATPLNYSTYRYVYCDGENVPQLDNIETRMFFGNLSNFACISQRDIKFLLPKAKYQEATDGVSFYSYVGKVSDQTGTRMQFLFRALTSCALSVTIEQSARNRYIY